MEEKINACSIFLGELEAKRVLQDQEYMAEYKMTLE
jgi:hypothetical protein